VLRICEVEVAAVAVDPWVGDGSQSWVRPAYTYGGALLGASSAAASGDGGTFYDDPGLDILRDSVENSGSLTDSNTVDREAVEKQITFTFAQPKKVVKIRVTYVVDHSNRKYGLERMVFAGYGDAGTVYEERDGGFTADSDAAGSASVSNTFSTPSLAEMCVRSVVLLRVQTQALRMDVPDAAGFALEEFKFRVEDCVDRTLAPPPCSEAFSGTGEDYRGCQTHTVSGRLCQNWESQFPHAHGYTSAASPTSGVGPHRYCRNPDGLRASMWCFTIESAVEWELCDPLPAGTAVSLVCTLGAPCAVAVAGSDLRPATDSLRFASAAGTCALPRQQAPWVVIPGWGSGGGSLGTGRRRYASAVMSSTSSGTRGVDAGETDFLTSTWPDGVWSSLRSSDTWRDGRKYALPGETENAHLGPARPRTLDFTSFPVRTDTGEGGPSALRTFNTFSKSDCRQLCLLNSFCRSFAMRKTKSCRLYYRGAEAFGTMPQANCGPDYGGAQCNGVSWSQLCQSGQCRVGNRDEDSYAGSKQYDVSTDDLENQWATDIEEVVAGSAEAFVLPPAWTAQKIPAVHARTVQLCWGSVGYYPEDGGWITGRELTESHGMSLGTVKLVGPDTLSEPVTCASGAPCFVQVTGMGLGSRNRIAIVPGPLVASTGAEWKLLARQTVGSHRRRGDTTGTNADDLHWPSGGDPYLKNENDATALQYADFRNLDQERTVNDSSMDKFMFKLAWPDPEFEKPWWDSVLQEPFVEQIWKQSTNPVETPESSSSDHSAVSLAFKEGQKKWKGLALTVPTDDAGNPAVLEGSLQNANQEYYHVMARTVDVPTWCRKAWGEDCPDSLAGILAGYSSSSDGYKGGRSGQVELHVAVTSRTICDESMTTEAGEGYRGCQTRTRSGRVCQDWSANDPHDLGNIADPSNRRRRDGWQINPGDTAGYGLADGAYCRNPWKSKFDTIWCFTTDPAVVWELCDPLPTGSACATAGTAAEASGMTDGSFDGAASVFNVSASSVGHYILCWAPEDPDPAKPLYVEVGELTLLGPISYTPPSCTLGLACMVQLTAALGASTLPAGTLIGLPRRYRHSLLARRAR
jgi:hypothetical protein